MKNSREEVITPSHTSPRGGRRGVFVDTRTPTPLNAVRET